MNRDEARELVLRSLSDVAPEIDLGTVDPDVRFQEQFDLDSMDVLNYVTGLEEGAGIRIPETDYAKVTSLTAAVDYLSRAGAPARSNG